MRITIKDIARKVGVTPATVSMVINNNPKISIATRERVQKAIKEMNYRPNFTGRSLVKGRTNNIALVAPLMSSFFTMEIVRGVESKISGTEYNLVLYSTINKEKSISEICYEGRADGVIFVSVKPDDDMLKDFERMEIPAVFVEEVVDGFPGVKFNNVKGAYVATEYLLKTKRKNIGIIIGKEGMWVTERLKGYRDALEDNDVEFKPERVARVSDDTFGEGKEALRKLLKENKKLDAVFCASGDITAVGVIQEARQLKINVPEELGVVGFDDIYLSGLTHPAITTVNQPEFEMGTKAFELLMEVLTSSDKKVKKVISFDPELVIRDST
jgi:LacI family transcriptional regulator